MGAFEFLDVPVHLRPQLVNGQWCLERLRKWFIQVQVWAAILPNLAMAKHR